MLLNLIGLPIYAFLKAKRERLGQVDEPVDQRSSEATSTAPLPLSNRGGTAAFASNFR
jgi:hypothetical protein